MGWCQRAAYLEFLANNHGAVGADNAKTFDATATASLHRDEVDDAAKIFFAFPADDFGEFVGRIGDVPAIEIGRFAVVVVEDLLEHLGAGFVTEGVGAAHYPGAGIGFVGKVDGCTGFVVGH